MKLIVGIGNPGSEYAATRHNVGFELVEEFAARLGWISVGQFDRMAKTAFDALTFSGVLGDEKVLLLKPMTYVNLSGQSVQAAMAYYRLEPDDLMVAVDDLALACGMIRLRGDGSSGGHNGLKDIQRVLGTDRYPRLRIGIDPVTPPMKGKDYVLARFTTEQRARLEPALARACGAIVTWIDKGLTVAMNQFNAAT
ncbi:MAG: aminoacyl-tRNA hydrolase [Phycisphaerae bacterium]|nr:aminoacyl-tRNA hydrolase [Phycisphaerae bacterium]